MMKSAIACILFASQFFNAEARGGELFTNGNCHNCSQIANANLNSPTPPLTQSQLFPRSTRLKNEVNCLETFTDGTNTAFRVVVPDSDRELRGFGGFAVGYHLLICAGEEDISTPLLLPEVDVPSPGMMTLSYVVNRVWPEGTRFSVYLYDRDGNALPDCLSLHDAVFAQNVNERPQYICYRSFKPQLERTKDFAEMGIPLRCFFAANTINHGGGPYCDYPVIWNGFGKYDWAALDAQVEDFLMSSPDA